MRKATTSSLAAVAVLWAGCTAEIGAVPAPGEGSPRGGTGADPDGSQSCAPGRTGTAPPPAYSLEVDSSTIDPFVVGAPPTVAIGGAVEATAGLDHVEVGGAAASMDGSAFSAEVPVTPGLMKVPILAVDAAGHERVADRSLLSATFLPEGAFNPDGAALVLDDDFLAAMIAPFLDQVADIDIAEEVMGQAGGLGQGGCDVNLNRVSAGEAGIRMFVGPAGDMMFEFTVPDVDVSFSGSCNTFIMSATFQGRLQTDVLVGTTISIPYTGACADPGHTFPTVELPGYNLDLDIQSGGGGGGGFMDLIMPIVEAIMQGVVKDQMATSIAETADEMIAEQSSQFADFDAGGAFSFAETDIAVGFCLTELGPADGQLRARVGLSAQGPGGREAPGAPLVAGDLPAAQPSSLWVDANLIGQFMYSLWTSGSFHRDVDGMLTVGTLALVMPELSDSFCEDTPVTIRIDAKIPPLVSAAPPEEGDLVVQLGDLMVDLVADDEVLLGLGANLRITLDLVPEGGALMPVVTNVEVDSHVASEPMADIPDDLILGLVNSQFDAQVEALLGDAGFQLPALGGLELHPADVTAEPGGRFLRVTLAE